MEKSEIVRMYERGQIVIPKDMRKELNLESGSTLAIFKVDENNLLLRKMEPPKIGDWKKILSPLQSDMKKIGFGERDADKWVSEYRKKKR